MSKRNIQIPYSLFLDLLRFFCTDTGQDDPLLWERIRTSIEEKVDRMANRERYQNAMLATSDPDRRRLLQEYYDMKHTLRKKTPDD
jgi:hypothetical protein